ncbi:hypothetical protein E2C01_071692 [Portunus trituberculatus]|uniref:Uncharacterized protein n=1 Tax=Portunus trituberculatus TaxID=210409 RepID=A0A5B7I4K9_PORTR|nr:hypothetical protein [Portunus trituberculatus]
MCDENKDENKKMRKREKEKEICYCEVVKDKAQGRSDSRGLQKDKGCVMRISPFYSSLLHFVTFSNDLHLSSSSSSSPSSSFSSLSLKTSRSCYITGDLR